MTVTFQEHQPHELWSLKEPTANFANGVVVVTLTVCALPPPAPAVGTPLVLYLEVDEARHLRSQLESVLRRTGNLS
jgi:hypothetical protein